MYSHRRSLDFVMPASSAHLGAAPKFAIAAISFVFGDRSRDSRRGRLITSRMATPLPPSMYPKEARATRRWRGPLQCALLTLIATISVHNAAPSPRYDRGFRGGSTGSGRTLAFGAAAVLCLVRIQPSSRDRLVWRLVAAALACQALAKHLLVLVRATDRPGTRADIGGCAMAGVLPVHVPCSAGRAIFGSTNSR